MRARRHEDIVSTSSAPSTSSSPRKKVAAGSGSSRSRSHQNGSKMEMYDNFYKKFVRPPMAPIYYPTAEEFADPIEYVAKIRPEAEKYGVVKIVPPPDFKPPFAIDKETFTFRPRTQKLNEVEAIVKEKHTFIDRLINFNRYSGLTFEFPTDRDGNVVDLYRLHRIVQNFGGCEEVNEDEKWRDVAREYLPKEQMARGVPSAFINLIRSHYNLHIEPFNRNLREKAMKRDDESDDELEELKHKYQHHHGTMRSEPEVPEGKNDEMVEEECPMSMQSGRRRSKNRKVAAPRRTSGKRVSGRGKKNSNTDEDDDEEDPMESVYCIACNQGKDEELLLLCDIEGCKNGRHTYCCDPVLDEVPEGEWRCPTCIESEDSKIGLDWGFYDADTEYNLNSFTEFANKWKCDYFGVSDVSKVSCELVEREFWKNLVSNENPVSVKYGADLITSRVGSGFPRKEDKHTGPDCKLKQQYANHAWNLNNMPVLRESVLSYFNTGISGMMVPWVYVGMCFSTFCWHTEDHWTYSVNYNHFGERKIWYGVGGDDAEKFEEALKKIAPGLTGRQRDLFHHMTTAANPSLLRSLGVPIYSVHQNAGEFVITFPRAYHAGYNEGLNFAEAVNFAPIDWLAKGRQCVESYSSVRRYLVFSHDELLFKMIEAMDKLGLSTTLATHDELKRVIEKQKMLREILSRLGVTARQMEQVNFEKIPDEQRSCRFCKTTLFMCALVCNKHKRMTCVEHRHHLCKTCSPKDYKYQYRFEIDHLKHLSDELGRRTINYTGWKEESDEMLEEEGKPKLERIEEFIDVAKHNKYPQTDQVHKLITIRHTAKSAIEKANQLLYKKVRTRTKTRCQRADTRTDTEGVRSLIEQMHAMDCNLTVIIEKLEKWMEQIEIWRAKSTTMINEEEKYTKEEFEKVIEEGDEYDIKLAEIEELKKVIEKKKWTENASLITSWTPTDGMEKEVDFEYKLRYTSKDILALIRNGSRNPSKQMTNLSEKLQQMLSTAIDSEREACDFVQNPSLAQLQSVWQKLRQSDWYYEQYINAVRFEVVHAAKIKSLIDSSIHSLSSFDLTTQLHRLTDSDITLPKAIEVIKLCETSRCLKGSEEVRKLSEMVSKMKSFTERLAKLFKPNHPYHNLFEILSERDDLTPLAEGQIIPLYFQGGSLHSSDEWHQMKEFRSMEQMVHHQSSLREMQSRIFEKVKSTNSARGLESCSCLGHNKEESAIPTLKCIMCDSLFHVRCCEWSPFLQRLPQGCFLCVRCLRGQRPVIDDVVTALNGTPPGFLETQLVRNLIQKSRVITQNLMEGANKRQQGEDGSEELCRQALFDWLSCEILNLNGLPKAVELISEFYSDYLQSQARAFSDLQRRPVKSKLSVSLFDPKTSMKRKRPCGTQKECSKKPRKRQSRLSPSSYYEEEAEFKSCQARSCLKPYGDSVNWVMCDAGCKNWFHVICVGCTLKEVTDMHEFRCSACLDHADSPSSSVSTE
uniref:Lysine-specific demethylase rbr-2 n=1 Tax=Caenorhabditis tropicalis TaxID=1561998 RepID=A0A1I7UCM9_9PELO